MFLENVQTFGVANILRFEQNLYNIMAYIITQL